MGLSVCSRRRLVADRHFAALPFPFLERGSTKAAVLVRCFCFSVGGGPCRPRHEPPDGLTLKRVRGRAHGGVLPSRDGRGGGGGGGAMEEGGGGVAQTVAYQKRSKSILAAVKFSVSHCTGWFDHGPGGGGEGWHNASVFGCLPLAAPIGQRRGGAGTRPRYPIVCLWQRLLASRHCSF